MQSIATTESEAFASDSEHFVLKFRLLDAFAFLGIALAFSAAFLEGRARQAPTRVLPCAHLGVSRHRRAQRPRSRRRRQGGSIFFGPGDLFRCCCSATELIVTDSILAFFSLQGSHVSALLMLPLSSDSLALRAAIDLFDTLGLYFLGGCLPLPLVFLAGRSATRAFSGCRAVIGTRSLDISVVWF